MRSDGRHVIAVLMLVVTGLMARTAAQAPQPNLSYSFHVGSAHPLGTLDSLSDANIHVDVDWSYRFGDLTYLKQHWNAKLVVGFNQFTAESFAGIAHLHWFNVSANLQLVTAPSATGLRGYLQAGSGIYVPKTGPSKAGFNAGLGAQVPVGGAFSLELGIDFHQIQTTDPTRFASVQLGVLFH